MLAAVLTLACVGLVLSIMLVIGSRVFYVEVDPRIEELSENMPGANCGGCGYAGCSAYAKALVMEGASTDLCAPGGAEMVQEIGRIMGVEVGEVIQKVAVVHCAGDNAHAQNRFNYIGVKNCSAAAAMGGGFKACPFGCLGLGSCVDACPFDAIRITPRGVAVVDAEACTGCGNCVDACPKGIISLVPKSEKVHVLCSSTDKAKAVKNYCDVGCIGCKLCGKESKRFEMKGALAVLASGDEEIPESAALVCKPGCIFDGSRYDINEWLETEGPRKDFESRQKKYKEEQKKLKEARKKAKEAEKTKKTADSEQKEVTE